MEFEKIQFKLSHNSLKKLLRLQEEWDCKSMADALRRIISENQKTSPL